jgi:ATP-dependent Clp protease adaptor protein ClpS
MTERPLGKEHPMSPGIAAGSLYSDASLRFSGNSRAPLLARGHGERENQGWVNLVKLELDVVLDSPVPIRAGGSDPPGPIQTPHEGDDVELEDKPVSSIPRRYKVIFHNDDYTTQEFVIYVLERFFHKSETEARHIMLTVHHKGAAVAGVYTKDVAETKAQQVMDAARENGMPLLITTEPE